MFSFKSFFFLGVSNVAIALEKGLTAARTVRHNGELPKYFFLK